MPCLFKRDFPADRSQRECYDEVTPGCEWVLAGEGVATRKHDGTAVLVKDGAPYARYDAKRGKTPPAGAIPCEPAPDPVTGHWPHWVKVDIVSPQPQFKFIHEAWANHGVAIRDGTYEAIGPAINSNREKRERHELIRHGSVVFTDAPRTHSALKAYLAQLDAEGIVFHHPDGRMAKIRRSDFLLSWPTESGAPSTETPNQIPGTEGKAP